MFRRPYRTSSNVSARLTFWPACRTQVIRLPRAAPRLTLLPLHAGLSTEEQLRVFETPEMGKRKVIVATNIAEVRSTLINSSNLVLFCIGQRYH